MMGVNEEVGTMNDEKKTIRHFTDIHAWQEGRTLVVMIYELTKTFPMNEQYGLTSQIKRAVVSITSNIAEGFKRETMKDKMHFYVISHGSLTEVQNQLFVALDVKYVSKPTFEAVYKQTETVDKLLTGLIRASKERIQ